MPSSDASTPASEDDDMLVDVNDSGRGSDSEPESIESDGNSDDDGEEEQEEEEQEDVEEDEEEKGGEGEEEEEDQEEGEEGDDDEEEKGADLLDSPAAADDDLNDSSHEIESEGHDDLRRQEKIEEGLTSCVNHDKENSVRQYDPFSSNEPVAKQGKELPHSNDGDSTSRMSGGNLDSSETNGLPESVADNKGTGILMENEARIVSRRNVRKVCLKDQNYNDAHLGNCNSIGADGTASLCLDEMEVGTKILMKDGSDCKVSSSIPISQAEARPMDMESGENIKLRASSSITPQLRPRSLSPGAEVEEGNKKPAIICDFFAKGWCIKGSSCRFLHQKDSMDGTSQCTKENVVVGSSKDYSLEDAGLRQEDEKPLFPSSGTPDSSIADDPSAKSHTSSGRNLLGVHGESKMWHGSYEEHKLPSLRRDLSSGIAQSDNSCASEQLSLPNELPWRSSVGEEYKSFGSPLLHRYPSHDSDFMDNDRLRKELVGGYSLGGNDSISSYRFSSSGSAVSSSIYGNSNNSFGYGKSVMEPPGLKLENQSLIYNSRTSPEFSSSLNSSFSTSLPSIGISPSNRAFALSGSSPTRSSSLPRHSSSPFYSRSAQESLPLHVVPRDPSVSIGTMAQSTVNNWEPSVPFQPSFHLSSIISSPGSQYDPLLDSIEPPNGGVRPFQPSFSQGSSFQNISHQQITGDSLTSSQHPRSAVSNQSIYSRGMGAYMTAGGAAETVTAEQHNGSPVSEEEKPSKPGNVVSTSNVKKVDLDHNARHQTDGSRYSKEAKMLKLFRASLVDLVKELVKPSWREGQLSKDAHNIVVKKAVDKVLNALQTHQIPSTTESISQYLSSSRPKLAKLVEGYVAKYGKS